MTREQAIAHGKEQLDVFGGEHREFIEMAIKALEQAPTTKNDIHCLYTDEEIAQSFKEDVEAVKDLLPTTKNDLEVDCIDRAELLKAMDTWDKFGNDPNEGLIPLRTPTLQDRYVPYVKYDDMVNCVKGMPSVTPQPCEDAVSRKDVIKILGRIEQMVWDGDGFDYEESRAMIDALPSVVTSQEPQTFKWCTDCREYDQEKHCCHRWSKVIRNTVEDLKQEYIEREVLDKIIAEIKEWYWQADKQVLAKDPCVVDAMVDLFIRTIYKYKAETEVEDGNDD